MPTQFIIVRHGDAAEAGVEDPGLSGAGVRQAEATARYLADAPGPSIAAVYTSPLLRARLSAEPVAELLGTPPIIEERVAEFDRARAYYSEHHTDQLAANEAMGLMEAMQGPAFRERVLAGFDAIESAHTDATIVVVCHGGVISTMVSAAVYNESLIFLPAHGSITRIQSHGGGLRNLVSYNEASWLADLD
ncbi:MAG: histidine phosphatase family protein [Actinomycetota bacterium]